MRAYEFSTSVTSDGKLIIPNAYSNDIPIGNMVRVIVLVNDEDGQNEPKDLLRLEDVVNEIKNTPQDPANVRAASGLLAEHLASSPEVPDPSFDVAEWNRAWDKIETEMEAGELAEQEKEANL